MQKVVNLVHTFVLFLPQPSGLNPVLIFGQKGFLKLFFLAFYTNFRRFPLNLGVFTHFLCYIYVAKEKDTLVLSLTLFYV